MARQRDVLWLITFQREAVYFPLSSPASNDVY